MAKTHTDDSMLMERGREAASQFRRESGLISEDYVRVVKALRAERDAAVSALEASCRRAIVAVRKEYSRARAAMASGRVRAHNNAWRDAWAAVDGAEGARQ